MMFDSWINLDEPSNERVCTFCDEQGQLALKIGSHYVHLCGGHANE